MQPGTKKDRVIIIQMNINFGGNLSFSAPLSSMYFCSLGSFLRNLTPLYYDQTRVQLVLCFPDFTDLYWVPLRKDFTLLVNCFVTTLSLVPHLIKFSTYV
jgi:hypothetical protein